MSRSNGIHKVFWWRCWANEFIDEIPTQSMWTRLIFAEIFGVKEVTHACTQTLLRILMLSKADKENFRNNGLVKLQESLQNTSDTNPLTVTVEETQSILNRLDMHFHMYGPTLQQINILTPEKSSVSTAESNQFSLLQQQSDYVDDNSTKELSVSRTEPLVPPPPPPVRSVSQNESECNSSARMDISELQSVTLSSDMRSISQQHHQQQEQQLQHQHSDSRQYMVEAAQSHMRSVSRREQLLLEPSHVMKTPVRSSPAHHPTTSFFDDDSTPIIARQQVVSRRVDVEQQSPRDVNQSLSDRSQLTNQKRQDNNGSASETRTINANAMSASPQLDCRYPEHYLASLRAASQSTHQHTAQQSQQYSRRSSSPPMSEFSRQYLNAAAANSLHDTINTPVQSEHKGSMNGINNVSPRESQERHTSLKAPQLAPNKVSTTPPPSSLYMNRGTSSRSTTPTRTRPVQDSDNTYDQSSSLQRERIPTTEEQLAKSREIALLRLREQKIIEETQQLKLIAERERRANHLKTLELKADLARFNASSGRGGRSLSTGRAGRDMRASVIESPYHKNNKKTNTIETRYDTTVGSGTNSFNIKTIAATTATVSPTTMPIKSILKNSANHITVANTQANASTSRMTPIRASSVPPQRPTTASAPSNTQNQTISVTPQSVHHSKSVEKSRSGTPVNNRNGASVSHVNTPSIGDNLTASPGNETPTALYKYLRRSKSASGALGLSQQASMSSQQRSSTPTHQQSSSHNYHDQQKLQLQQQQSNHRHSVSSYVDDTGTADTDNDSVPEFDPADEAVRRAKLRIQLSRKQQRQKEQEDKEKKDKVIAARFAKRDKNIALFKERQVHSNLTTEYLTSAPTTPDKNGAFSQKMLKSGSGYNSNQNNGNRSISNKSSPIQSIYDHDVIAQLRPDHFEVPTSRRYTQAALEAVGMGMSPNMVLHEPTSTTKPTPQKAQGDKQKTPTTHSTHTHKGNGNQDKVLVRSSSGKLKGTGNVNHRYSHITADFESEFDELLVSPLGSTTESILSMHTPIDNEVPHDTPIMQQQPAMFTVHVLRAYDLTECLDGTSAYITLDWGREFGKNTTQCVRNTTTPEYHCVMKFKSPLKSNMRGSSSTDSSQPSSVISDVTEFEDLISNSITAIRIFVYNKNISISDELIAIGEFDVYEILHRHYVSVGGGDENRVNEMIHTAYLKDPLGNYGGCLELSIDY